MLCLGAQARLAIAQNPAGGPDEPERFVQELYGDQACLVCHGKLNIVVDEGNGSGHSLWIDPNLFWQSIHSEFGCTACHTGVDQSGHRLDSPLAGEGGGTTTDASPALDLIAGDSRLVSDALKACINCHPNEYLQYKGSIHGVDVLSNLEQEPPFCTDCHGSHYILQSSDERAWTNPKNIPYTCLKCHAEATIQQRFDLGKDIAGTFEDSFHGSRGALGGDVAICTSCHGSHEVYAASDGRSKINALQVSNTCGECHQGAQLNFAAAFTHQQVNPTEQLGLYILKQIYMYMVVGVIGMFMVLIVLDRVQDFRRRGGKAHG